MKNWQLAILLVGIAFLSAAFLFLNFRIAVSNTKSEKNTMTTSIGDGLPNAMRRREKINLVLIGKGPLILALQRAIVNETNNAAIGNIEPVPGIQSRYQSPVLVIKVERPTLLWTPFFATSHFAVQVGYSSSGDSTFMGETPITVDNQNGPALNMYGEYRVNDRSWGLISRPGYYQILANYLATQIASTLKDLYSASSEQY